MNSSNSSVHYIEMVHQGKNTHWELASVCYWKCQKASQSNHNRDLR
jgi:hypothetical protein